MGGNFGMFGGGPLDGLLFLIGGGRGGIPFGKAYLISLIGGTGGGMSLIYFLKLFLLAILNNIDNMIKKKK